MKRNEGINSALSEIPAKRKTITESQLEMIKLILLNLEEAKSSLSFQLNFPFAILHRLEPIYMKCLSFRKFDYKFSMPSSFQNCVIIITCWRVFRRDKVERISQGIPIMAEDGGVDVFIYHLMNERPKVKRWNKSIAI